MTAHPELDFTRPIRQVAEHAEAHRPGFAEEAKAWILLVLGAGEPLSGEQLTQSCKNAGIIPHDDRAFGWVYRTLSQEKKIVKAGSCARACGHGTNGGNIWRLA